MCRETHYCGTCECLCHRVSYITRCDVLGVCACSGTVTQTGLITRADVLRAQAAPSMGMNEARFLVGGDFFGSLKNFLGRAAGTVRNAYGAIQPWASAAAPLLRMIAGAGMYGGSAESPQQDPAMQDQQLMAYDQPAGLGAKRKEYDSPTSDPREQNMHRPAAPNPYSHQQSYLPPSPSSMGYESPARAMVGSGQMYEDEPDDRYEREPRRGDSRSPAERYDSEMDQQYGPPERVSRRRAQQQQETADMEDETPTPQPRRGAVFR